MDKDKEMYRERDRQRWTLTDKERESETKKERLRGSETCEEKEVAQDLQYGTPISTHVHDT